MTPFGRSQTMLHVTGTVSASGDSTLISAPGAGKQIVISALTLQNESSTATTALLKFGSTTIERILGQSQGDGVARSLSPEREWEAGDNTALVLNLSGANQWGYSIHYWIDAS